MRHPLSTEAMVDWLKTKPARESYEYSSVTGCLVYQYLAETGLRPVAVAGTFWVDRDLRHRPIPAEWHQIALGTSLFPELIFGRSTFGRALKRGRHLLTKRAEVSP